MYRKRISVIVRTKNSSNIIDQTLKALFSQSFTNFDLIIVDSQSQDDTLKKVSKYKHSLIGIKAKDYHPGRVINEVLKICTTEVVVFLNSDCVLLLPKSLQLLIDGLSSSDIHAVFARQICRPEALLWVQRDYEAAFPNGEQPSWMHFSLPFAAIKTEVWKQVPFYTQSWASEDTKWATDIKKKGFNVKYIKEALVMHSHNYNLKQIFNRKYVEGEADAFIFGGGLSWIHTIRNYLSSVYYDFCYHRKDASFFKFIKTVLLRFVYHLSYYRGYQYGMKRKNSDDKHLTFGDYQ